MIQLAYPAVLLVAPAALAFLFLAARRGDRESSRLRRAAALLARCAVALALIVTMAGPSAIRAASLPPCVVFAVDVSESVDEAALEEAARAIESASQRVSAAGGWSGLVAFAGRPSTLCAARRGPLAIQGELRERLFWRNSESRLSKAAERGEPGAQDRLASLSAWRESIDVLSTRLAPAVLAAETLFRPDADNRAVVLTDGREPHAVSPPGDDRVAWVQLPVSKRRDLIVTGLSAPTAVRHGEPFDVRVEVEANHPGEVALALTVDDLVQNTAVERFRLLAPGRYTFTLNAPEATRNLQPGLHRLMVIASQEGEEERRNNQAFAAVTIIGKPQVLLVEGAPLDGEAIARILSVQQIGFKRIATEQLPVHTDRLDRYAAVVLAGVAPGTLPAADIAAIREYVENGGGLLVVGTSRWTDARALDRAEFAEMLPIEATVGPASAGHDTPPPGPRRTPGTGQAEPKRVLAPTVALLLAIDKSGSMATAAGGGVRNIDLAREACIAAAETLTEHDYVGVLAFDVKASWAVDWTRAESLDYFKKQLLRLQAHGGTNIYPALVEAYAGFRRDSRVAAAGVKHVILLSDGVTPPADFEPVLSQMARDGITVTTVCVGMGEFDPMLMKQIANIGKGRFLFTGDFKNVPKIFTNEAKFVIKESAREADAKSPPVRPPPGEPPPIDPRPAPARKTVAVRLKDPHEVAKGLESELPPLQGVLASRPRRTAYVPLATADGEPVLALWRFGLGKCAVWMSDVGGPWSQEWTGWAGTPRLFAQLVRHLSSAVEDGDLASRVSASREGDELNVRVDVGPGREELELHLLAPRRERIDFGPAVDGARTARVRLDTPGVVDSLVVVRRGEREEQFPLAAVLPYPMELASPALDRPFGGLAAAPRSLGDLERTVPPPPSERDTRSGLGLWFLLAAALLLPLDVALRRVR